MTSAGSAADRPRPRTPEAAGWRLTLVITPVAMDVTEAEAVLAAAGSADLHPMRGFKEDDRRRWDQDMEHVDQPFAQANQFFLDVISGGFARPEVADHVAFTFFGQRGPWYTVGYRMGALGEKRYGRAVLVDTAGPPTVLARYNRAAAEANAAGESLPRWSAEVLKAVGADEPPAK